VSLDSLPWARVQQLPRITTPSTKEDTSDHGNPSSMEQAVLGWGSVKVPVNA
jgi:hypothetical protein